MGWRSASMREAHKGWWTVKFRKRPVVIEAVQLRWDTWSEMCEFANVGSLADGKPEGDPTASPKISMLIPTLEGLMRADENDWIIRGVKGELYPCKPDIFDATYELVEDKGGGG